ncbi:unnamed protein product [Aureobasidium vineae]|uniref:Uncharacterized protein n=1 Tax=Aureobasidium vineae TaxID=2773715 RepID=A0A9N8PE67_9PEZI|nr:unnamed protein product [Aureobasidium vineae]
MAYTSGDPHMVEQMEMVRRLATLEAELRIEREQHALAQQCITYMARQLASQDLRPAVPALREESQPRGRRLERYAAEPRAQAEIEQKPESREDEGEEQMREQKAESEDLLACDNKEMPVDSVHSPILVPHKTRPAPTGPRSEQTFRTKCLAFLERDEERHEPVDTGKDAEGTLFTFENSGDVGSEDPPSSDNDDAKLIPVPDTQDAKKHEQPLTLKSLSDRYKDHKPTEDGLNASVWAGEPHLKGIVSGPLVERQSGDPHEAEKTVNKSEEQEDLMQFPETDEVSEDTAIKEPEKILSEEQKEKAKRSHAAELRKNQALVMYDPAPSEDAFRTVLVTDIPKESSAADVMRMVSGGMIVKVQSMNTTPITGSKTMMITFLQAKDARDFLKSVEGKTKPEFSLLKSPTYPTIPRLADDMMYNGVTRCLAIRGVYETITMKRLCEVAWPPGLERDNIVNASRDEQGVCHLEFTSVLAAKMAHWFLKTRFDGAEHEADPCDRRIPGVDEEDGLEEESEIEESEEGEIVGSGDGIETESETQAGAETESKSKSSAGEKDADGWPIGGLDYD